MKMTYKKALLISIVFFAVLFGGDRLLSLLVKQMISFSENRFVSVYEGSYTPGVLILGNSRSDAHFPASWLEKISGMHVDNIGIGGESTVLSEALLYDYVDRLGKPKLLIIEPTNLVTNPALVGDIRLFGIYSERIRKIVELSSPDLYYGSELFHLLQYNNEMFVRVMYGIVKKGGGSRVYESVISDQLLKKLVNSPREASTLKIFDENIEALQRIITFAENKKIPFRIVISPYFLIEGMSTTPYTKKLIRRIQEIVGEQKVWNYAGRVVGKMNFRDSKHLNAAGVTLFHQELVDDALLNNF